MKLTRCFNIAFIVYNILSIPVFLNYCTGAFVGTFFHCVGHALSESSLSNVYLFIIFPLWLALYVSLFIRRCKFKMCANIVYLFALIFDLCYFVCFKSYIFLIEGDWFVRKFVLIVCDLLCIIMVSIRIMIDYKLLKKTEDTKQRTTSCLELRENKES